jgi:hypothetical protein
VAFIAGGVAFFAADKQWLPMAPAFAAQMGYVAWAFFAALVLSQWKMVWMDMLVLGIGLIWLILRPGFGAVIYLSIYESLGLALNLATYFMVAPRQPAQAALLVHISLRIYALAAMWVGRYRIAVLVKDSHARTGPPLVIAAADDYPQPPCAESDPVVEPAKTCDPVLFRAALTSFVLAVGTAMMASIFVVLRWCGRLDDWPLVLLAATASASLGCFLIFEGKRDWLKRTTGTISSYVGFSINLLSVLAAVQIACQPELLQNRKPPQPKLVGWSSACRAVSLRLLGERRTN